MLFNRELATQNILLFLKAEKSGPLRKQALAYLGRIADSQATCIAYFLHESAFRPHETSESGHRNRISLKSLSRGGF